MASQLNYKHPTFFEGMVAANVSDNPTETLREIIKADRRWVNLLGYAINPDYKMVIPTGNIPYRETDFPEGLADYELLHLHDKLYVFYNPGSNIKKLEEIIIRHCESLTPDEAKLLVAIKDKTLHQQFANVTEYVIVDALGWKRETYDQKKANNAKSA